MQNTVKISIIMPVYNTAQYLPACIDSIRRQSLKEIEIICVDDGSTDECLDILESYAAKDERIRVMQKDNGGPASARKAGLRVASGQYIGFVDSDDWIEENMYELLYQKAGEYQADMVTCGFCLEGNYTTMHMDTVAQGLYAGEDMQKLRDKAIYNLAEKSSGLKASLCYKLFKRELICDAQYMVPDEITMADDKMCLLTALLECNSVYVFHKALYHYRIRANSIVHSGSAEYLLKVYAVYKYMQGLFGHKRFTKEMRWQSEIYITELLYKGINTLLGFENKNLLWIDPYWLDQIPEHSRIVLYGAGELGRKYLKQLQSRKDLRYVTCIDAAYEKLSCENFVVESPDAVNDNTYDYIVITIKNPQKAKGVREELIKSGVADNKVLWFDQAEFFWKFAKAEGAVPASVE